MDPAMCVWLMIVAVCACWLGEEFVGEVGGYVSVWVSGEVGLRAVFCCNNLYYGFFFQYVCLSLSI